MEQAQKTAAPAPVKTNIDLIKDLYEGRKQEIAKMLNDVLAPDKLFMVAMTHVRKNPILAQCDRDSFVNALVESAQLGLDLNPALGYAYLVPKRKNDKLYCEFQVGYRGLIYLATASGMVNDIFAQIVYDKEEFKIEYGLHPLIKHIPKPPSERGDIIGAYAVARLKNGVERFEYLWQEEIEKIKKKSESLKSDKPQFSPWNTSEEEMIKKTATRRLGKWVPLSPHLTSAAVVDEYRENGIEIDVTETEAMDVKTKQKNSNVIDFTTPKGEDGQKGEKTEEPQLPETDGKPEPEAGNKENSVIEAVKSRILECKNLEELKIAWENFNVHKKEFSKEERKAVEILKDEVKNNLAAKPEPKKKKEEGGKDLFNSNENHGNEPECENSGEEPEYDEDVEMHEIAVALNECETEKDINAVWKNSMNVISKLKGDGLKAIIKIKNDSINRVKENA